MEVGFRNKSGEGLPSEPEGEMPSCAVKERPFERRALMRAGAGNVETPKKNGGAALQNLRNAGGIGSAGSRSDLEDGSGSRRHRIEPLYFRKNSVSFRKVRARLS